MAQQSNIIALRDKLNSEAIQKKFSDILGKKSAGFLTSVMSVAQNNALLAKAEPNSVVLAAGQAAALDLPINPNLGYAAIVPYNDKKSGKCLAQFQIMRDGWVELAMRTGQVVAIANEVVYEGELVSQNRFTDTYVFDESKRKSDKIIGYMAYIRLANNFEKTVYWTVEQCKAHGARYSKSFSQDSSLWKTDFSAMSLKTVLKFLIKKYCPKSIEMLNAVVNDQGVYDGDLSNIGETTPINNTNDTSAEKTEVVEVEEAEVVEEAPATPAQKSNDNRDIKPNEEDF